MSCTALIMNNCTTKKCKTDYANCTNHPTKCGPYKNWCNSQNNTQWCTGNDNKQFCVSSQCTFDQIMRDNNFTSLDCVSDSSSLSIGGIVIIVAIILAIIIIFLVVRYRKKGKKGKKKK